MLTATDSFLQYLDENLDGVPVHWLRIDPNDENSDAMQMDALNVRFLGFWQDGTTEDCLVSLDLLSTNERTALGWLAEVRDLLVAVQFAPEWDYVSNPLNPQQTSRGISWDGNKIRFLSVRVPRGQRYVHYNCTFPVTHARE
jgi:hypothetical protein